VYPRNNLLNSSAEWVVSTALFEEGVLMSSSPAETFESTQYFAFDNPQSSPAAKDHDYVFRPSASSHEKYSEQSSREEHHHHQDEPTLYSFTSLPDESNPVSKKWISDITQHLVVKSPKEWSAESPFIYTLVIILRNATDGRIVQAESCRVAFRSVDVWNGLLRVNNKPITIRGTNLLEYDCDFGCSIPRSLCELDLQLMKRNNINAIRTPPHDPWLYELCTLYGLYVINEVNIQPHFNSLRVVDDPDWEISYLTRLIRLYGRDKIHPSIIIWSLGNRSGYGRIHDKMAQWIRATDPTRLVMYEPASYGPRPIASTPIQNRTMATDILCPMYAQISDLITLANRYPDHPVILSEYSLMTGNAGGKIEEYWNSFNDYRRLQGGFLSNWIDHDFVLPSQTTPLWNWFSSSSDQNRLKALNSLFFSGVNWHDRGQAHAIDDIQDSIPHGLVAQMPHSGFSRAREIQEMGRIWVKPQLLEVKQCMKLFDCNIPATQFSEAAPSLLLVNVKINIFNFTDHLEDLSQLLCFDIYLICNGALVSVAPFLSQESSVMRHSGDAAGGRDVYQRLTGFCEFVLPIDRSSVDHPHIHGIQWPEDLLSILSPSPSLLQRISDSEDPFRVSVPLKSTFDWKVVILSRLVSHMSWGSAGLPMGFKQLRIERADKLSWDHSADSESDKSTEQYSVDIRWIDSEQGLEPNVVLSAGDDCHSHRLR
jgi:hypothetical protein